MLLSPSAESWLKPFLGAGHSNSKSARCIFKQKTALDDLAATRPSSIPLFRTSAQHPANVCKAALGSRNFHSPEVKDENTPLLSHFKDSPTPNSKPASAGTLGLPSEFSGLHLSDAVPYASRTPSTVAGSPACRESGPQQPLTRAPGAF